MPKKIMNNEKLRNKIEKLLLKYEKKNKKEEKQLELSKKTNEMLKSLLKRIPKESNEKSGEFSEELSAIHENFKNEMRKIKEESKKQRKERKMKKSENRKEKKQRKVEKALQLDNSRIEELPELKENELESFEIIVDGWNICGCDKIARKSMRGKRHNGAKRMIDLLSKFGLKSQFMKTNGKNVSLEIHFDGNGKSEMKIFDGLCISVKYSGKSEIVDDRLVRELTENISNGSEVLLKGEIAFKVLNNPNRKYLVVTSDRELSLRLNKIGVNCMKSGCFYKKYLKEFEFDGLEENENESKESEIKVKSETKYEKNSKNGSKNGKNKKFKKEKNSKKGRKHWKKYVKNKFSDNSSSSNSSESSDSSESENE